MAWLIEDYSTEGAWLTMRISRKVKDRAGIIGCSAIGAWLGVSTYSTPYDAYLEYKGQKPEPDAATQERLDMGTALEDFIAKQAERKWGIKLRRTAAYADPKRPWLICHPDRLVEGLVDGSRIAVEIKSSSAYDRRWGDEGSDQIPMDYLCQCMGYYLCTVPCDEVWLIRFSNNRLTRYIIGKDRNLMEGIASQLDCIFARLEKGWVPSPSSYEEASRLYSSVTPDSMEATDEVYRDIERLEHIKGQIKDLKASEDEYKARIVSYMAGHSSLFYRGQQVARYSLVEQQRLDTKRLKADHPDLFEEYSTSSSYTKLTI